MTIKEANYPTNCRECPHLTNTGYQGPWPLCGHPSNKSKPLIDWWLPESSYREVPKDYCPMLKETQN